MEQLLRKKALEHGQKLLEKDVKWKESLTKAVEKVESAKKQVVAKEKIILKLASKEKEKANEEEIKKKEIDQILKTNELRSWPGGGSW